VKHSHNILVEATSELAISLVPFMSHHSSINFYYL